MKSYTILFSILLGSLTLSVFSQNKYEYEERVPPSVVPKPALDFIQAIPFNKKVKWYREQGLEDYTFETKTKYKKRKYSIEFNKTGQLEDVEIIVCKKDIEPKTYQAIKRYFEEQYDYHRIQKIQLQLTGDVKTLQNQIKNAHQDLPKGHYEIVVKTKINGEYLMKEYLFSPKALPIKSVTIVLENTFHLEF